jgi:hypothetical protein
MTHRTGAPTVMAGLDLATVRRTGGAGMAGSEPGHDVAGAGARHALIASDSRIPLVAAWDEW